MNCQQQLSVRNSAGVLEAPSGYALRGLQDIKAKRTVYLLRNRTILFATNRTGLFQRNMRLNRANPRPRARTGAAVGAVHRAFCGRVAT